MPRHASETALAIITLIVALVHFTLETWFHLKWGQPLQALIVDYISVALMLTGAGRSLQLRSGRGSAAGLLAVGWAYALGFGWRSVFGRLELLATGTRPANGEPMATIVIVLIVALTIVAIILAWALALAWRQSPAAGSA